VFLLRGAPRRDGEQSGAEREALPATRPFGAFQAHRIRAALKRGTSLRLRLALLSTSLLAATLLVFSFFVYFTLERLLAAEVDRSLSDRAQVMITSMSASPSPFGLRISDVDTIAGVIAQVVDLDGDVATRSEALQQAGVALPVSPEALEAGRRRATRFELTQVEGVRLRVLTVPLVLSNNRLVGVLQVARPIGATENALAGLQLVLVAGTVVSTVLSVLLGLLVARAALRPIDRLTREAEQIGRSQDLSRRVPSSGTDEVGRLAATFNATLDRLQSAFTALQSANRRLEAALESQRRFVADASHELRTPLTTVRGNASLLRKFDVLTTEDREAVVAQIASESERMSRLVSDLLTLARADAGQSLEHRPVALGPIVESVAHQGRLLANGKVSIALVRIADVTVMGHADSLRQLVLILVDNAIKYTPRGGAVTLSLRLELQAGRHQVARLTVVDTGPGIDRADLPRIFDRFYRADRARGPAPAGGAGGTGLGLAIGKWIADAHGGQIDVESEPGSGSIFTVTLPTIPALPTQPAAPTRALEGALPTAAR
jgi:signal transduction histidine kinase